MGADYSIGKYLRGYVFMDIKNMFFRQFFNFFFFVKMCLSENIFKNAFQFFIHSEIQFIPNSKNQTVNKNLFEIL